MTAYTFNQIIDFTRTSAATYVANTGFVTQTPASRNLLTYTQEFDNAAWTKSNATALPFDPAAATYGAELVTNGDFSGGATGWTPGPDWSISAGAASKVSGASAESLTQTVPLTSGMLVRVTYTVTAISGVVFPRLIGTANVDGVQRTATGVYTDYLVVPVGYTSFAIRANSTTTVTVDNISVREVIGGLITAPDGTLTGDALVATAGTAVHWMGRTATVTAATAYTFSVYVKAGTSNFIQLLNTGDAQAFANFNVATGAVGTTGSKTTASIASVGNGWYRCIVTFNTTASLSNDHRFYMVSSSTAVYGESWTATGTESLYLWGAQLEAVPDANLVLGSELVSNGAIGLVGTATAATYNTGTGVGTVSRVDTSNQSFVQWTGLTDTASYRFSVTNTGASNVIVRSGNQSASVIRTVTPGETAVFYGSPVSGRITITAGADGVTSSFTLNSFRQITGTTGMPTTYTRNVGGLYPPRFDYDPVTLAPRGLLVEEQRTNLLLRSEEFDNASWVKASATVTANAAVSPDGTMDADKVIVNNGVTLGTGSAAGVRQTNSKSASATTYAYSTFLKVGEFNRAFLFMSNSPTTASARALFDLAAGTVSAPVTVGAFSGASAAITPFGNGWYRCTLIATSDTDPTIRCDVFPADSVAVTGDGTSGIYLWGAQLEAGAFATSYIPTVASQVTRTADLATVTGANFSRWYNQSAGSFVIEFQTLVTGAVPTTLFALTADGNTSKRFVYIGSSGEQASTFDGTTILSAAGDVTGSVAKVASAYDASARAIVSNGGAVTSGAVAAGYSTASSLNIGGGFGGNLSVGHIRRIRYYPTRLSNAQLQALTA